MRIRTLTALAVLGLAAVLSGLAAAGSSSVSMPRLGSNAIVPADKAAAMANRMPTAATDSTAPAAASAAPTFAPDPIPAKILASDVPVPIPGSVITVTNSWLVSNGYNLVAVYAGSAGDDPTQGRVVIVRQDLRAAKQTVQIVDAGSTGPLTINPDAPNGTTALAAALNLGTSRGATVRLNLNTNTISTS